MTATYRYVSMYCMHVQKGASEPLRTHFKACEVSRFPGGMPPDPSHTIQVSLFVFALGPSNPLSGPGWNIHVPRSLAILPPTQTRNEIWPPFSSIQIGWACTTMQYLVGFSISALLLHTHNYMDSNLLYKSVYTMVMTFYTLVYKGLLNLG